MAQPWYVRPFYVAVNYIEGPAKSSAEAEDKVRVVCRGLTKKKSWKLLFFTGSTPSDLNRGAGHVQRNGRYENLVNNTRKRDH